MANLSDVLHKVTSALTVFTGAATGLAALLASTPQPAAGSGWQGWLLYASAVLGVVAHVTGAQSSAS